MAPRLKTTDTGNGEKYIPKLFRLILVFSPFPLLSCLIVAEVGIKNPRLFQQPTQCDVSKMLPSLELRFLTQTTETLGTLCATSGTYTQCCKSHIWLLQ